MSTVLAHVTRGDLVESRHYGSIVVSDSEGKILASAGDPELTTYFRSACKPIQGLEIFCSGAYDKYHFTDKQLSIMCSSHFGEMEHQQAILELMDKIGLSFDDYLTGSPYSYDPATRDRQLWYHTVLKPYNSDCSGKHTGFLASCKAKGYPTAHYNDPKHPLQQEILAIVAEVTRMKAADIHIGIDGCSVPVHGMPIHNMAMGYARFTTPKYLPEKFQEPARKIFHAMTTYPLMVGGHGSFCTDFMTATHGRFIGKLGAESLYCIGVKDKNIGITVKIADGSYRPLFAVVMSTLKQLDLLTPEEEQELKKYIQPPIINDHDNKVGEIIPAFKLQMNG